MRPEWKECSVYQRAGVWPRGLWHHGAISAFWCTKKQQGISCQHGRWRFDRTVVYRWMAHTSMPSCAGALPAGVESPLGLSDVVCADTQQSSGAACMATCSLFVVHQRH